MRGNVHTTALTLTVETVSIPSKCSKTELEAENDSTLKFRLHVHSGSRYTHVRLISPYLRVVEVAEVASTCELLLLAVIGGIQGGCF